MFDEFEFMNGIILYQSKCGDTKKYVDWILEEPGFSCFETKKAVISDILNYDIIILGGEIICFENCQFVIFAREYKAVIK